MINSVYTVVQQALNKNGYGFLTPTRFVYFAEAAQLRVIDETVDELRMAKRNFSRYSTPETLQSMEAVVERFAENKTLTREVDGVLKDYHELPSDYFRWGSADIGDVDIVKIDAKEKALLNRSYFATPSESEPYCYIEGTKLYALPVTIGAIHDGTEYYAYDEIELHYYRYPVKPNWTYKTILGKPVFDSTSSLYQDFEVPQSCFNKLVTYILELSGVSLREELPLQYATNREETDYKKKSN